MGQGEWHFLWRRSQRQLSAQGTWTSEEGAEAPSRLGPPLSPPVCHFLSFLPLSLPPLPAASWGWRGVGLRSLVGLPGGPGSPAACQASINARMGSGWGWAEDDWVAGLEPRAKGCSPTSPRSRGGWPWGERTGVADATRSCSSSSTRGVREASAAETRRGRRRSSGPELKLWLCHHLLMWLWAGDPPFAPH